MFRAPRRLAILRLGGVVATAFLVVLTTCTGASAHAGAESQDATQGGYGVLTFRVSTESDTASTTSLHITFPSRTPIASASVLTTCVSGTTWTSD